MRQLKWSLIVAMAISVCSCSNKDINELVVDSVESDNIAFMATIGDSTRATDIQFEDGDMISVFASNSETIGANNYAQNVCYTYSDGLFRAKKVLVYPSTSQDLTFFAVYPYGNYTTPTFEFAVQKDQRDYEDYTSSDLMTAMATGYNDKVVDLVFSHHLAKLVINLNADQFPIGEATVTLKDVKSTVYMDLNSNSVSTIEMNTTDVIAAPNGTNSFKVLLPPQAFAKKTTLAEITIGENIYQWVPNRDIIINGGVEYQYTIDL